METLDVVCCYDLKEINKILDTRWKADGAISMAVSFGFEVRDDFDPDTVTTTTFNLQVQFPKMVFIADNASHCQLTMTILSGEYTRVRTSPSQPARTLTQTITASSLAISLDVPLVAINHQSTDSAHADANQTITFQEHTSSADSFYITIDFDTTKSTQIEVNEIVPSEQKPFFLSPDAKPAFCSALAAVIKDKLKTLTIQLAGINNKIDETTSTPLRPKSFMFSAHHSSDDDDTLNLYIETTIDGSQPGNRDIVFQPGGRNISPVPDSYSASLILSQDLLYRIIKPQLEQLQWQPSLAYTIGSTGLHISLAKANAIVVPGVKHLGVHQVHSDDITIRFDIYPLQFMLTDNGILQITWDFVQTVNWKEEQGDIHDPFDVIFTSGSLDLHATINKSVSLQIDEQKNIHVDCVVNPDDINLSFKVSESGFSAADEIKDHFRKTLAASIGKLEFHLSNINVFATTNLLFPDEDLFNIQPFETVHVPKDLILFGHLLSSQKATLLKTN